MISNWFGSGLVVSTIAVRVITNVFRWYNFAPVAPLSTFGGARWPLARALGATFLVMIGSDLLLWVYNRFAVEYRPDDITNLSRYGAYLLCVLLGKLIIRRNTTVEISSASMASSISFYLITNFVFWRHPMSMYTPDLQGLLDCYVGGLMTLAGTMGMDLAMTLTIFKLHDAVLSHEAEARRAELEPVA